MKIRIFYDYNDIEIGRTELINYLLDDGWDEENLLNLTEEELIATVNENLDLDQFASDFDNDQPATVRLEFVND